MPYMMGLDVMMELNVLMDLNVMMGVNVMMGLNEKPLRYETGRGFSFMYRSNSTAVFICSSHRVLQEQHHQLRSLRPDAAVRWKLEREESLVRR